MYRLTATVIITLVCAGMFAGPVAVFAESQDGPPGSCGTIVPCGCDTNNDGKVSGDEQCGFNDLITGIQNVLDWLMMISVPVAALMFAYAGWLYITARGDKNKIQTAHKVFVNVGVGFALVLGAWVIVYTIADVVLEDQYLQFIS